MKNLTRVVLTFFSVLLVVLMYGCANPTDQNPEALQENPQSIVSPENFYRNTADFESAIAGILRSYVNFYGVFDTYNIIHNTAGAEDVTGKSQGGLQIDQLRAEPTGNSINVVWEDIYQAINEANLLLANLPNADAVSQADKDRFEGQARYARALGYFYLTRWFGEIPLITAENVSNAKDVGQSPVQDIYDHIVNDLTIAKEKLEVDVNQKVRPTKGAAAALLAEVYINMTGWPLKDQSKYALARAEAADVMTYGYELEPDVADLWVVANKLNNSEHIFIFNGIANTGGSSHHHAAGRPGEEGGWEDYWAESRWLNIFPDGPRKDATFLTTFRDEDQTHWTNSSRGQPFVKKWLDAGSATTPDGLIAGFNGDGFWSISRYAEVLLIFAEAENMVNGPTPAAYDAINQVRARAGGYDSNVYGDLTPGLSQSEFDDAVIAERGWELTAEGKRWFDLVRKEMVVEVNQGIHPDAEETDRLLPKPATEVELINGMEQNPGY